MWSCYERLFVFVHFLLFVLMCNFTIPVIGAYNLDIERLKCCIAFVQLKAEWYEIGVSRYLTTERGCGLIPEVRGIYADIPIFYGCR